MFNRRPQSDFSDELRAHLELEIDRLRGEGMSEADAWHAAHRNLGNLAIAGEIFYESNPWMWLDRLFYDTKHALRRLAKAPAFTLTATLTLALGIGATTSIFTLVHAVLLKSLPVSNPDQLFRLGKETHCCVWGGYNQENEFSIVSYELYEHFRDNTKGFAELAAFRAGTTRLGVRRAHGSDAAATYPGEFVSGNYFPMFGVSAYAGRALTPADDSPVAAPVAVMSYRLWQQKYGLDPSVIGGTFDLNDKSFTIVGISPPGFFGDTLRNNPPDFFLPLATEPLVQGDSSLFHHKSTHWLDLIGRIRPGVNPSSIEAQMRVELHQWLQAHIGDMDPNERARLPQQTLFLSPGGGGITSMREAYEHWLRILMMVSGFVLLIVCANVANLMLVRGLERRQQMSLSMALGARPSRLVGQALVESVLLALLGGVAGLAVAFAGARLILHFAFRSMTSSAIGASPSIPVLLFAFVVSVLTGIAFGVAPAWMATRVNPVEALRGSSRSTRRAGSLPRKTLVIVQAALSLVLLSASGLLTAALRNIEHQDFGFEQDNRTIVNIDPVLAGYKPAQLESLYRRVHDAFTGIPGVASVSSCLYSPQSGDNWNDSVYVEGRPAPGPKENNGSSWDRVTAGYFETIGNPILEGRPFSERDTAASPRVAVVNEAFARKFFKNENPVGKHFGTSELAAAGAYEIVGVAKDARYATFNLQKPIAAYFFLPEPQSYTYSKGTSNVSEVRSHFFHDIVIRMRPGIALQEAQVHRAIASVDPNLPVVHIGSLREEVAATFSSQRLIARLTSLFGILALVLASIGLYGVTSYNAGSRTAEIGVRMALGADRGNVVVMILQGALTQIALGLAVGIPLTLAAGRFLGSQLYGINRYDPGIIAIAILSLSVSALVAAWIPAFRASSISPIQALRV
jgi:predicted permease